MDHMKEDNQNLRHELVIRERQLANLTKNIPGGIHQCANDANMTLLSVSDGFLSMFGYTREEIETLFAGKFINMVYPGDRAKMIQSTCQQLEHGSDIELEYRVLCKNGQPVWVLDKGRQSDDGQGNSCFYCMLIDITERKRQEEELRLSLERHQVIMDQATDIIFEWDILKDTLEFSSNWEKKFGYEAIRASISSRIPFSENICKEDMPSFLKLMKDTAAGVPYSETEFRIRDKSGQFYWCRIRATAQYNSDGRPVKAVGVIVDIDEEKKQKQALIAQAQYDTLTGIYNKSTINALVEQRMQNTCLSSYQALFIIDVDYFKAVNDTYGHLSGDSVLSDVAAALKGSTRSSDLVGRIGGDEFLVYLPEIKDEKAARQKAESILETIGYIRPEPGAPAISCSIGGAVWTRENSDYQALYLCADRALYQQKNGGRGGVSFWDRETIYSGCEETQPRSAVGNVIVSDEGIVADEWLAQYVFRTLYIAKDIEVTLNRLLEIIGRSFDVGHVYIFESSMDGSARSNTFEWCGEGITSQRERLQNIPYEGECGDYRQNFDEKGVYCFQNAESLPCRNCVVPPQQEAGPFLQCAILDDGKFSGYVGYNGYHKNKFLGERQISAFKLTADVLSIFLLKMRQKQKLLNEKKLS